MPGEGAICVFVKTPQVGKVKTRLAKSVGDEAALDIYLQLLRHTASVIHTSGYDAHIYYSDHIPEREDIFKHIASKATQNGKDLGKRMDNASANLLSTYEKAVIIGSDCGQLTADIIKEAFYALDLVDLVIGPARDGGYYLIGMKQPDPTLFNDIEWSTSKVLLKTLERANDKKYELAILPTLRDVDTIEDWLALGCSTATTK